ELVTAGHRNTRHSRTRVVLRLISCSPRRSGFFVTVIGGIASANLTPASRRQDHTTSPSASARFVKRAARVHRIPSRVRDDRDTPLVSRKFGIMCERAVADQPPVAGTEPATPQRRQSLSQSEGQLRCLPQPEQLQGLRARTEQGREWMMAQNDLV